MHEQTKLSFEFARDTVKQIISLSTAVIALSVTFAKDIFADPSSLDLIFLIGSWVLFLLSILAGIGAMMAMCGTLDDKDEKPSIYGTNISIMVSAQTFLFVAAMVCTVAFGVISIV